MVNMDSQMQVASLSFSAVLKSGWKKNREEAGFLKNLKSKLLQIIVLL